MSGTRYDVLYMSDHEDVPAPAPRLVTWNVPLRHCVCALFKTASSEDDLENIRAALV